MSITQDQLKVWRKLVEAATPPTNTVSDAIEQRAIWQLGRAAREVIPALIDALAAAIAAKEKAEAFGIRAERATLILADEFEMDGDTILRLKAERVAAIARADALAKEVERLRAGVWDNVTEPARCPECHSFKTVANINWCRREDCPCKKARTPEPTKE